MYKEKHLDNFYIYRNFLIKNDFNNIFSVYNISKNFADITDLIGANIIGLTNAKTYIDNLYKFNLI